MATQHSRLDYRSPTHLAPLPWPALLPRPDSKPLIDPLQRFLLPGRDLVLGTPITHADDEGRVEFRMILRPLQNRIDELRHRNRDRADGGRPLVQTALFQPDRSTTTLTS